MLDLNDVALFVQVVRAGSFAAAARRLGMPANTASRRIQQLEQQLGLRLMQRSTRKLTLTDAGATFYARCADQVEALAEAAQELGEGSQVPSGKVRVAAPADFFNVFRMELIAEFLAAHPKVRLEFVLSDARADLIEEGIDVAIRSGKVLEPTLVARRIGTGRATLVASPAYLAARGTPESVEALADHDCVDAAPTLGAHRVAPRWPRRCGRDAGRRALLRQHGSGFAQGRPGGPGHRAAARGHDVIPRTRGRADRGPP